MEVERVQEEEEEKPRNSFLSLAIQGQRPQVEIEVSIPLFTSFLEGIERRKWRKENLDFIEEKFALEEAELLAYDSACEGKKPLSLPRHSYFPERIEREENQMILSSEYF